MIKIEVTGHSIPEVADKLLAIGASLQGVKTTQPAFNWFDVKAEADGVITHDDAAQNLMRKLAAQIGKEVSEVVVFEPSVAVKAAPVAEGAAVNADALKQLVLSVVRVKGRDAMVAVLDQFGVTKATEVPAEQSAELVAALEALL